MSSNHLNDDTCQYRQVLAESTAPGSYMLNTPSVNKDCKPCYPAQPTLRLQKSGDSVDNSKSLVDVSSELLNITRPATKCPSRKWEPNCPGCPCSTGEPCGPGVISNCNANKEGGRCPDQFSSGEKDFPDCEFPTAEDTRLSNPPCTLRGTGWNRWEWLCLDPQTRVIPPFRTINDRLATRDNYRPCLPKPLDQTAANPPMKSLPQETIGNTSINAVPTMYPATEWKPCQLIPQL